MRSYTSTTTLSCDRCRKTVDVLIPIYVRDRKPITFQSSSCDHAFLIDLCEECYEYLLRSLGKAAIEADLMLKEEAARYRNYR